MNSSMLFRAALVALVTVGPTFAAATTWTWKIKAIDAKTDFPVAGATIEVHVTDLKKGNKQTNTKCKTDPDGACTLIVEVSGGFFSGSEIKNTFSLDASNYSRVFTFKETAVSDTDYSVVMKLTASNLKGAAQSYLPGIGPTIHELAGKQPIATSDLFSDATVQQKAKGKFETEEAYTARIKEATTQIISGRIVVNNDTSCSTTYSHESKKYIVSQCVIFPTGVAVQVINSDGSPLTLSNAFDTRTIARRLESKYAFENVDGFVWSAEFELSAQDAEALENELMAAVEVDGIKLSSECSSCTGRESSDKNRSALESLAALGNRPVVGLPGWRDAAFKSGVLHDVWLHHVSAARVHRYFIYRNSDKRVLFEMRTQ